MTHKALSTSGTGHPQLVFHIGDPKTGTSSIQRALQDKSVTCETRQILPWITLNARNLAFDLTSQDEEKRDQKMDSVRKWLASGEADYAVISSEFMARANPNRLKKTLVRHLPEYGTSARAIAYVRPHASRFLAAFIQRTKTGHYFGDFDSFHEDVNRDNPLTLHYSKRFNQWRKAFEGQFTLRPFLRSELRDGDAVRDFFSVLLDEEPFTVSGPIEENVSVTTRSLSGMRYFHKYLQRQDFQPQSRAALGSAIANYFIPMGEVTGEKPKLDRKTAERIVEAYRHDAQRLDKAFFSRPLMTEALEKSARDTVDEPLDLDVTRYFSPAEVSDMENLSAEIARKFQKNSKAWTSAHRARKQKGIAPSSTAPKWRGNRRIIHAIDSDLSELAAIFRG